MSFSEVTMRLFEEEISPTIATDGPCEVLRVEERMELLPVQSPYQGSGVMRRRFGVVIYKAKTRMHPVPGKTDGHWELPESATTTGIIIVKPSIHGTELPSSTGRYLGSFRQGQEQEFWHAFLAKPVQEPKSLAGSEAPKGTAAPSPAKGDGPTRVPDATGRREPQPSTAQTSTPRSSAPHGRQ